MTGEASYLLVDIASGTVLRGRGFEFYSESSLLNSAFLEWGNRPPHWLRDDEFDREVRRLVDAAR